MTMPTTLMPPATAESQTQLKPLVLDLDGTLIRGNLLVESALAFVKQYPLRAYKIIPWLLRGRAALKQELAREANVDIESLPLNEGLVEFAAAEATRGRPIFIATAADREIAAALSLRLPFPTTVIASDGRTNLKGAAKAAKLHERFPDGFDYAGNSRADLPAWRLADGAIVVEAGPAVETAAGKASRIIRAFPRASRALALLKAMRPHQWAKNALVFVPLILAGRFGDPAAVAATVAAFLGISLVASGTYIVNDILDLPDDRRHWSKRNRPLASGRLPVLGGAIAAPVLLLGGLVAAHFGGPGVVLATLVYVACTLAYSLRLKKVPILDGFALASLFTLRLGAGILASGAPPSPWLLVFSMFLFASLSFAKRHTEVARVISRGDTEIRGRGYRVADLPLILALGIATGMCAVLIMVLYIIDDAFHQSFYGSTLWLWGFPAVLFLFICRVWLVSQRGEMHDDPIAFAVRDRPSLMLGATLMICFAAAWIGVAPL